MKERHFTHFYRVIMSFDKNRLPLPYCIYVAHSANCPNTQQSGGRKWQVTVVRYNEDHVCSPPSPPKAPNHKISLWAADPILASFHLQLTSDDCFMLAYMDCTYFNVWIVLFTITQPVTKLYPATHCLNQGSSNFFKQRPPLHIPSFPRDPLEHTFIPQRPPWPYLHSSATPLTIPSFPSDPIENTFIPHQPLLISTIKTQMQLLWIFF